VEYVGSRLTQIDIDETAIPERSGKDTVTTDNTAIKIECLHTAMGDGRWVTEARCQQCGSGFGSSVVLPPLPRHL
jgi:hypothetical protein